jgi:hypothetical protein
MKKEWRFRFWLEIGAATVTAILFMVTLVWRDWIEIVFRVEPDGGNGSLEWWIVAILLVVTVTLFGLARYEWRRVQTIMQ